MIYDPSVSINRGVVSRRKHSSIRFSPGTTQIQVRKRLSLDLLSLFSSSTLLCQGTPRSRRPVGAGFVPGPLLRGHAQSKRKMLAVKMEWRGDEEGKREGEIGRGGTAFCPKSKEEEK